MLRRMATADALVMSRSSYSYVAAILNANGIVVYHPFWHSPLKEWLVSDADGAQPVKPARSTDFALKEWLVSDADGAVSEAELIAHLKCWKRA